MVKNAIQTSGKQLPLTVTTISAEGDILLADIGHFESERFTKNILWDYISEKFTNFAVCLSDIDTNPINYLQ